MKHYIYRCIYISFVFLSCCDYRICHICEPTVLLMNKSLSGFGKDPQNIVLFTSLEKIPFKERRLFQACKTNYYLLEWGNTELSKTARQIHI